jgi:ABC-type transport system substrate-binding protein
MTSLSWVSAGKYAHGARRLADVAYREDGEEPDTPEQWTGRQLTATRIEAFMYSQGAQAFLRDADIDAWYKQQITERDPQKRQALLYKIQQKAYDEALFMPIWENAFLCASGPRVAVSGLRSGLLVYSAPYEDVRLKSS